MAVSTLCTLPSSPGCPDLFDTATYDEIEKDVSVTFGDQLGAIGGTLGLFAGFSIISGVEILYFVLKGFLFFLSKKKINQSA